MRKLWFFLVEIVLVGDSLWSKQSGLRKGHIDHKVPEQVFSQTNAFQFHRAGKLVNVL